MDVKTNFKGLSITKFLEEIDRLNFIWIVKRLSGNDTGLTGGKGVGIYLSRDYFEMTFPEICTTEKYNPDAFIVECYIPNADIIVKRQRVIYYNSKFFPEKGLKKKHDEFRITRWGGSANPFQNIENTGSICIFAVSRTQSGPVAVAWVASSIEEENTIEAWLGEEVEPGRFNMRFPKRSKRLCLPEFKIPAEWLTKFPSGHDIFQYVENLLPRAIYRGSIDELLLRRRELEFQIFENIEQQEVLPNIQNGFDSVDAFIKYAHSVSNRRKSRTGTSLELNLESIFCDEKISFETQVVTENRKKPDFLFPSGRAYHDQKFPAARLHMLASKTCCKDRWRQVLNEANRITPKHLFTLQQGVSGHQLQEMRDNEVKLVVPAPFLSSFPKEWRGSLLTLEGFIGYIRSQQADYHILKMDKITPERRSWNMSRIKGKNTKPEIIVRSLLHKAGYRFRIHRKDLPGKPDIVLPKHNTVIFVHGCYWHRHPGCRYTYTPKSRMEFWNAKFAGTVERDIKHRRQLIDMGWKVEVIWECETENLNELIEKINKIFSY